MAVFKIYLSDGITQLTNIKNVSFKEAVNAGDDLRPGCVESAAIEFEVFDTQENAVSAGDTIFAYCIDVDENATLLGKFNCEPKIDTKNSYKVEAYDNASKLNADFSQWLQANQSSFPMTVYALVSAACTVAGVTLGSASWGLSTQSVQAFYADGITCRDVLSYAAELAGCFVRCHTDGSVYFDWYAANSNSIAPSAGTGVYAYKQDGLTYANYTTTALARVAVHPSGEDDVAYIYPTGVTSGNTLHVKNNLLLTGADASFYNAAAQQVYTAVSAVGSYCPMSVSLFPRENPFHAGDIVSITDAQGVTISAPITGMTISNAAATLISEGRENYEDTTETAKAIAQLASDVVRINKLKVSWAEIDQAIITYLTTNNVTAQNLTIVDANDVVLATFNANGITIGQTGQSHVLIDFNSLELIDKDGVVYASLGDARGSDGTYTLAEIYSHQFASEYIFTTYPIVDVISVSVDGVAQTGYTYTQGTRQIRLTSVMGADGTATIEYKTNSPVYHYDLGSRVSGSLIGPYSVASGKDATSSGLQSSVLGGTNNTASGSRSVVCGGNSNTASGANGSAVLGGTNNTASGFYSAVINGNQNIAQGDGSAVCGWNNSAIGVYQFVFGRYNDPQSNYVEIVGNGTYGTPSNARTLDWNGNETLTGGLTQGGIYVSDANTIPTASTMTVYRYDSSTFHTPYTEGATAWQAGVIFAFSSSANNCGELALTSGASVMYYRRCYNGTWTAWAKVYDTLSPPTASEVGAVDKTGDTMSGELANTSYFTRKLPTLVSGTTYPGIRFEDENANLRGGLGFYYVAQYGEGIRLYTTRGGATNGVAMYIDANGNSSVVFGQPDAWRAGLNVSANYSAGDTISFPSTDHSYFTRFHGDWRDTKNLYFFIPTSRSCVGLTATVSGLIYLVTNGVRNSVSMSNVTPTCFCTDSGIAVRLTWATAPSYAVQYNLASVQPYGFTVTFS